MPSNIGNQLITLKYRDDLDNTVVNSIGIDIRKLGMYSGGYLTKVDNTTVSLSALSCEIGDGTYQIHAETSESVNIIVSTSTPIIILRWVDTGSADDYMEFLAVGDIGTSTAPLSTDIIVGKCNFSGSTLVDFDYTDRTNPNIHDLFLKVEPTSPNSMYVRIRAGRVCYGEETLDIVDQLSPLLVAPTSNSWVAIVQVDLSGNIVIAYGSANISPVAPNYGGLVTLAEITIQNGQTNIITTNIIDVRPFTANTGTLFLTGQQRGDIVYYDGANWALRHIGTDGQAFTVKSDGTPGWETVAIAEDILVIGMELIRVSDTVFNVDAGLVYNSSIEIEKTNVTSVDITLSTNYINGVVQYNTGTNKWLYVYIKRDGTIAIEQTAPAYSDTIGTTEGNLIYYKDTSNNYWRCIGAVPIVSYVLGYWIQQGKRVYFGAWDSQTIVDNPLTGWYTQSALGSLPPVIAKLMFMDGVCSGSGTPPAVRPTGSTGTGVQFGGANGQTAGYHFTCVVGNNHQYDWNIGGNTTVMIRSFGYELNCR